MFQFFVNGQRVEMPNGFPPNFRQSQPINNNVKRFQSKSEIVDGEFTEILNPLFSLKEKELCQLAIK